MDHSTGFPAYLEVHIKFADDLGFRWAVDGYCVDWEVGSFEGPFCCRLGCDHSGGGCVPWNDVLLSMVMLPMFYSNPLTNLSSKLNRTVVMVQTGVV